MNKGDDKEKRKRRRRVSEKQQDAWRVFLRTMIFTVKGDRTCRGAYLVPKVVEPNTEDHFVLRWLKAYDLVQGYRRKSIPDKLWYIPTIKGCRFAGFSNNFARTAIGKWFCKNKAWVTAKKEKNVRKYL